jgi:hypothetical protein
LRERRNVVAVVALVLVLVLLVVVVLVVVASGQQDIFTIHSRGSVPRGACFYLYFFNYGVDIDNIKHEIESNDDCRNSNKHKKEGNDMVTNCRGTWTGPHRYYEDPDRTPCAEWRPKNYEMVQGK